ncbi:MAG: hypothetical protein NXH83_19350 [Rhodobacteraceae bacterium]|nr:hypothetical protein [Paracoccaceae bacterium]
MDGIATTLIHGSIDAFGGGGIVASIKDVARFCAALVSGATFDRPETLDLLRAAPGHPAASPYRMGGVRRRRRRRRDLPPWRLPGTACRGHP